MLSAADIDLHMADIRKGVTVDPISGLSLVREDLSSVITLMTVTSAPLRNRLTRIPGSGKAHVFKRVTPTTTANGLFLGTDPTKMFFEKGGIPDSGTPNFQQVSVPYAQLGDLATVTLFDIMAGQTFADVKKTQLNLKMINVALAEEWAIINGNSSTGPLQFDGLLKQITTNRPDLMGNALSLADLNSAAQTIYDNGGEGYLIVCSTREKVRISDLVRNAYYRTFQSTGEPAPAGMTAGVAVGQWQSPFGTMDIVASRYLPKTGNSHVLILDDRTTTNDGNSIAMVDMMPIQSYELANIQSASRTLIAEFTALMVAGERFQVVIDNVGTTEPA